ncbi:MAG: rhomboid family intramembrane serine protease [Dehalococcoidales bacterium]|nr:rhomboid family intramembrane serine protease [Dehalococcoidales bacterium]
MSTIQSFSAKREESELERVFLAGKSRFKGSDDGAWVLNNGGGVQMRQRADEFPPVLVGLILANVGVFLAWQYAAKGLSLRAIEWDKFLCRHFRSSWLHLRGGLFHTPVTSAFSHSGFMHLAFNMYALYMFAPPIIRIIGESEFLAFYLLACAVSGLGDSAAALLYRSEWRWVATKLPSLGASGAVFGIIGMSMVLFPDKRYSLMFVPVYFRLDQLGWALAGFDVLGYLWKLINGPAAGMSIAHMAHFSGFIFGYAYTHTYLSRLPQVKQRLEYNKRMKQIGM